MIAGEKGRQLVAGMPRSRVLLETDGPFATKADGAPWLPWETTDVMTVLCNAWEMQREQVREQLLCNLNVIIGRGT